MSTDRLELRFDVYQVNRLPEYRSDATQPVLHNLDDRLDATQQLIEDIPSAISSEVDEVLQEQYEAIEKIVQAEDMDEEEKMKKIQQNIRIGFEKGLPTLFYGRESERFTSGDE